MHKTTLNPNEARKNLNQLLKRVSKDHKEIQLIVEADGNNSVLDSLKDWQSIQETLLLEKTGVLDQVRSRVKDDSGFISVDEIDWDNL